MFNQENKPCLFKVRKNSIDKSVDDIVLSLVNKVEKTCRFKYYIQRDIRESIDTLFSNTRKNKSVLKAFISAVISKIKYKDWDTRLHKKKIGGFENLDSIDSRFISPILFEKGYYTSLTKFSLTESLNLNEPFTLDYIGGISPKESKEAFLFLMERLNDGNYKFDCENITYYIFQKLKKKNDTVVSLQNKTFLIKENTINMKNIDEILNEIFDTVENGSVLPVIAIHCLCINSWSNLNIKPLKEHTACDKNTNSYGDIEGYDKEGNIKLAIEVKHKIKIDDNIINIFNKKTKKNYFYNRFILTTSSMNFIGDKNNLVYNNVVEFIKNNIRQSPEEYILSFRKAILEYKNLDLKVKEDCEKIFEKYV
jgi:hypothetical protein